MYIIKYKPQGSLQILLLNIVGLSTESLTKDSSIIQFPFLLFIQQDILQITFFQSKPSYAPPLNQEAPLHPNSLLILGRSHLSRLPPGDQSYYHPHHACHIKHLPQVEDCVPTQLRQQVQSNLQKHDVCHIRITEAFQLYTCQIPKLNYKQETYSSLSCQGLFSHTLDYFITIFIPSRVSMLLPKVLHTLQQHISNPRNNPDKYRSMKHLTTFSKFICQTSH